VGRDGVRWVSWGRRVWWGRRVRLGRRVRWVGACKVIKPNAHCFFMLHFWSLQFSPNQSCLVNSRSTTDYDYGLSSWSTRFLVVGRGGWLVCLCGSGFEVFFGDGGGGGGRQVSVNLQGVFC
jgi:hypothetical protein